ncbi:transposase [Inquilinus limosus]
MAEARLETQSMLSIDTGFRAIFVSLELSRKTWLITSASPGVAKMLKHIVAGGDAEALLESLASLQAKAERRCGKAFAVIVVYEAGLDGFWIHRLLQDTGIECHVVDPASVAVSRRSRRAKTDRLDGETLVRTLMAFKRGEPRVCAMVRPPSLEEEDRRRIARERATLIQERVGHVNRIKGLLFSQGVSGYEPLRRDRRRCL